MDNECKCRQDCDGRDCDCPCHEIDHNDNTDYRKVFPRSNGAEVLLISWVRSNCKFAQMKGMVRANQLYSWRPKVEQSLEDIRQGRLSQSEGPVMVSKMDSIRGGWFIIDGHHRAIEKMLAGENAIPCIQSADVPFIERPAEAYASYIADMVRVADALKNFNQQS